MTRKEHGVMEPMHVTKTAGAKVLRVSKAIDDGTSEGGRWGEFEAMVSVFGNKDRQGDVVAQGAFTRSLAEWVLKGRMLPCLWSHDFFNIDSILGRHPEVKELDEGLWVRGELDLWHKPSERVHQLMKDELVTEFSWSGEVREYELLEDDEDSWWPGLKFLDIDLWEAGPCFKGANQDTELISVKSDGTMRGLLRERSAIATKAGRKISQANLDRLKDARGLLDSVISEAEPIDDEGEEAEEDAEKASATETAQQKAAEAERVRAALEHF